MSEALKIVDAHEHLGECRVRPEVDNANSGQPGRINIAATLLP